MLLFAALLGGAITLAGSGQARAKEPDSKAAKLQSIYVVAQYDSDRDPSQDLAAATARAEREKKRILLEVGRRQCAWCQVLAAFIRRNDRVIEELRSHYLIVKVPDSLEQPIFKFLADYPTVHETPHWFVLESDGKLLHSQNMADFESGGNYSESKLIKFLQTWRRDKGLAERQPR